MMRGLLAFLRDRSGAAAAEMGLVALPLIALMFGAMEAGNFFWKEHVVVKAVRDGVRFAGRQSFGAYSCPSGGGAGSINASSYPNLETQIKNLTRTGQLTGGTARVSGWTDTQVTVSVNCVANNYGIFGSNTGNAPRVTVEAIIPYSSLFGEMIFRSSLGLTLRSSSQTAVMGS